MNSFHTRILLQARSLIRFSWKSSPHLPHVLHPVLSSVNTEAAFCAPESSFLNPGLRELCRFLSSRLFTPILWSPTLYDKRSSALRYIPAMSPVLTYIYPLHKDNEKQKHILPVFYEDLAVIPVSESASPLVSRQKEQNASDP